MQSNLAEIKQVLQREGMYIDQGCIKQIEVDEGMSGERSIMHISQTQIDDLVTEGVIRWNAATESYDVICKPKLRYLLHDLDAAFKAYGERYGVRQENGYKAIKVDERLTLRLFHIPWPNLTLTDSLTDTICIETQQALNHLHEQGYL